MIEGPGLPLTILAFLMVIGPLVFIHELGHYLVGRWFGVKAEAFSIGFGREIAGWTDRRGTRWKIGWIPMGGYVRFAGDMNPAGKPTAEWLALPPAERNRTFQAKPVWQRALIVVAGPAVNFLAAILILAGFAVAVGDMLTPPTAAAIQPGSAAARAGLQAGDRIVTVEDREMRTFDDLFRYVRLRPDERVTLRVARGAETFERDVTIARAEEIDRFGNRYAIGRLGIAPGAIEMRPVSLIEAPVVATRQVGEIVTSMVEAIGQIVSGRRSVKELGGPLTIAKVSGQQATLGLSAFVLFVAMISINLGFINLLPVPMLDGGHLMFYAVEAVTRRPVGEQVVEWAYRGGLAALLALMVLVTVNDLGSFGVWRGLSGLIG